MKHRPGPRADLLSAIEAKEGSAGARGGLRLAFEDQ